MKIILILLLIIVSSANIEAKVKKKKVNKSSSSKKTKITYEDAKEHCLVTKGASISNAVLEKCIEETMKSKIKTKDLAI